MQEEEENLEFDNIEDENPNQEAFEHFRFEVDPGQTPLRIDKYLVDRMQNASRNKIQESANNGNIFVNDVVVKRNYKVKPHDVVTIVLSYPPREIEIIAEDIPLNIVYEDDSFIIVNKNPGMVVHPSYGHYSGTLVNALAFHLKNLPLFNSKDPRPGLVHRIDKDTSGILVIAKNEEAKTKLALQFFNKTSDRKYRALVWGNMEEDEGTITGHIGRNLKNRKVMDVFPNGEYGKHAVTHYRVLERLGYVNLVECVLETGRTHQIRAHFKHIGHPLFNDADYGGDQILKGTTFTKYKQFVQNCFKICPRQALHAKTLGFIHPSTNEYISFDSEIPEDMATLITKWREYTSMREE
ncbi:RluA family pseudouridine synthase [Ancylomarina salipaludis]|uniref:Pseudouridine synthase n=1 Tax=Ancylomarina salipaludis TaxID=2501299 RepID=A0A4Q1JIS8_9BACT|nr:RluA family pseudouridine synthase [Ancylomarina salipaludis]RXQ87489.1 RluA family pseudouridine synthase [Ancylomarina salipaludis]